MELTKWLFASIDEIIDCDFTKNQEVKNNMETKFTFNTNGNANKVKYVLNTSDNQEIEFTEEDAKVLQILKKKLIVELIDDFTTTQFRHAIEVRNHKLDEVFDEEDYLIVKRWLDGDDEE